MYAGVVGVEPSVWIASRSSSSMAGLTHLGHLRFHTSTREKTAPVDDGCRLPELCRYGPVAPPALDWTFFAARSASYLLAKC